MMLTRQCSYDCLSKSYIPILYHDICKYNSADSPEISSGTDSALILELNRRHSEILVKVIVRHFELVPVWNQPGFKTYLRITSLLFHYSNRTSRYAHDRLITVKHMRAKIGMIPLYFRGVKPDDDDYED